MRTPDGHTLHLPAENLDALISQLQETALIQHASNMSDALHLAALKTIDRLAHNAQRIGALRHRHTGERFPVYNTYLDGRPFELITRPDEGAEETVVSVRSRADDSGAEFMASAGRAVQYFGPMSFAAALADARANSPGLYRIHIPGGKTYDGRATDTIRARLIKHRWCLTHLGVSDAGYQVSIGPMPKSGEGRIVAAEKRAIRQARRKSPGTSTNRREGEFEAMFRDYREAGEAMAGTTPLGSSAGRGPGGTQRMPAVQSAQGGQGRRGGRGGTQRMPASPGVSPQATTGAMSPVNTPAGGQPNPPPVQQAPRKASAGGSLPQMGTANQPPPAGARLARIQMLLSTLDGHETNYSHWIQRNNPAQAEQYALSFQSGVDLVREELANLQRHNVPIPTPLMQRAQQRINQGRPRVVPVSHW
jgi:hypothetical protein